MLLSCQWRGSGELCGASYLIPLARLLSNDAFVCGRLKDGKGRDYFFNTITKKSQWVVPDEIAKEQKEQAASWAPDTAAKVEIEI